MMTVKNVIGACAATATIALIVVGFVSGEIARHVLQTLPLWPATVLGLAGSVRAKWAGLPVFVFWFAIMALIWAFLLGLSTVASGTYSPVEIAMTVVVGVAALVGLLAAQFGERGTVKWLLFSLILFALQVGAMALSLRPPFETDRQFLAWITG